MNIRRLALCAALSVLLAAPITWATAQSTAAFNAACAAKPHKLVLQVSDADPAKWRLALNNARNVPDDLGRDKVAVEIVACGPGIGMLKLIPSLAPESRRRWPQACRWSPARSP